MRTYLETFTAGQTKALTVNGDFFALIEAAGAVDLSFQYVGQSGAPEEMNGIPAGYAEKFPSDLTSVTITSSIAQTIRYGCGKGQAHFDRATIVTQQATSQAEVAPATVGTSAALVLAGNTARQRIIFRADDSNTGDIWLGGSGSLTTSNGTIKLAAGKTWIEERVAAAAWYAIATAAGQVLRISTGA